MPQSDIKNNRGVTNKPKTDIETKSKGNNTAAAPVTVTFDRDLSHHDNRPKFILDEDPQGKSVETNETVAAGQSNP